MLPANLTRGLVMTKASAKPYLSLGLSFRNGWLSSSERELAILRVGAATGAEYEIFHHRPEALAAGVPAEVINCAIAGTRLVGNDRLDALLRFVDQLVDGVQGAVPSTAAVQEHFTDNEIAEIVLLTGHYLMTAIFIKTLGISTDGDRPALFPGADTGQAGRTQQ